MGIRSFLGWTIIGHTQEIGDQESVNVNFIRLQSQNDDKILLKQVKKFSTTMEGHISHSRQVLRCSPPEQSSFSREFGTLSSLFCTCHVKILACFMSLNSAGFY